MVSDIGIGTPIGGIGVAGNKDLHFLDEKQCPQHIAMLYIYIFIYIYIYIYIYLLGCYDLGLSPDYELQL